MKRLSILWLAVLLLLAAMVMPLTAQESTAVNPFPTAITTAAQEPQTTPEVTAIPTSTPTDTQTEVINETSRLIVIGAIALGLIAVIVLASVLAFAVVQLGKSVPAPFAQPYYGAVYSGERLIESNLLTKLEQRAAATPEKWDDEIAAVARRVFNEQYQKVQQDAADKGVSLPDISPAKG